MPTDPTNPDLKSCFIKRVHHRTLLVWLWQSIWFFLAENITFLPVSEILNQAENKSTLKVRGHFVNISAFWWLAIYVFSDLLHQEIGKLKRKEWLGLKNPNPAQIYNWVAPTQN